MSMKGFYYQEASTSDATNSLPKKSSIRNESVLQKYLNDNHLTEKKPNNVSIQSDSALKYQIITQKSKTTEQKPSKIPVKDNPSVISKPPLRPQIPKSLSSNIKSPVNKIIPDKKQDAKDKHVQISKKEEIRVIPAEKNLKKSPFLKEKDANILNQRVFGTEYIDSFEETEEDEDEDLKNDTEDIEYLKKRLDNLRKKLFTNPNTQSDEFDSIQNQDDPDQSSDSSDDDDDEDSEETELGNKNRFTEMPKLNKLTIKPHIKSDKNFNIESIDLKAKKLIERSESSLNGRALSSDGLGSSCSSSNSILSIASSNIIEPQPYKPEFLRYLEDKNKNYNSNDTGEPLKPENDILYQWRLRRKLDDVKKPNILEPPKEVIKLPEPKVSIETQTKNIVDSAVQTSIDSVLIEKEPKSSRSSYSSNSKDEVPTRDINLGRESKKREKSRHDKVLCSSPIKENYIPKRASTSDTVKSSNIPEPNPTNSSSELTKVTNISITPVSYTAPTASKSPPVQSKKTTRNSLTKSKSSSLTTASTSTTWSTTTSNSTITNITAASNNLTVQKSQNFDKQNEQELSNSNFQDNNADDNLFESDEILQILFKKTYFYQMKLKQIDELLTR